jgi:DNA polymerase
MDDISNKDANANANDNFADDFFLAINELKAIFSQYKGSFTFNCAVSDVTKNMVNIKNEAKEINEDNCSNNENNDNGRCGITYKSDFAAAADMQKKGPLPLEALNYNTKSDKLLFLKNEKINNCVKCELNKTRHSIVFGEGNPESPLMFIGEAPGADEDATGRPFVGRAGQLLTKIIESIEFMREDVYIANILKCRPPSNRNPEKNEITACSGFLKEQIDIIKPKIICSLGKFATMFILNSLDERISLYRGRVFDYNGIKVIPTYHPSYLLRNPSKKRDVWEDMKLIKRLCMTNYA